MIPQFRVVPAQVHHCGVIARKLRFEHQAAILMLGLNAHRELRARFEGSAFRRAWFADDRLVGLGGVTGSTLDPGGTVWLALAEEALIYPLAIVKEARNQLDEIMRTKRDLVTLLLHRDATAQRFAKHLGFEIDEETGFDSPTVVATYSRESCSAIHNEHLITRRGAGFFPFIVYTAGRSRTAWLSRFLTYGKCVCDCESAITLRSVEEVQKFFANPRRGSAETAAAPAWQIINHLVPNIRNVVVTRPIEEVITSFSRVARIDEEKLRKIVTYETRCLEKISAQKATLTVRFEDLRKEEVCAAIFEHCLPYRFDRLWWSRLRDKNIQEDVASLFSYYKDNYEKVEAFKKHCKRYLTQLKRQGLLQVEV